MILIKVEQLSRHYGAKETLIRALDSVDLTIARGEFTAIVGPSGSGKSTLLHLIGGLDKPTTGNLELDGKGMTAMTGNELSDFRRDHIGFVFQAYNLIPVLTVEENVEYVMLLQGVPSHERRSRVQRILTRLGLAGKERSYPKNLSGGQQQRVAVARAIVSHPKIVLADEPTANLDSKTGAQLLELMGELNREMGMTFVFSTHDPMIMERARRIVSLHDGQISSDENRG